MTYYQVSMIISIVGLLSACVCPVQGQQIMKDAEGREILLKPDGSWEYLNPDQVKNNKNKDTVNDEGLVEEDGLGQQGALTEEEGAKRMIALTEQARQKVNEVEDELNQLRSKKTVIEKQISQYEALEHPVYKDKIELRKRRLQEFETQEKEVSKELARAQWYATSLEKLIFLSNKKRERQYKKVQQQYKDFSDDAPTEPEIIPEEKKQVRKNLVPKNRRYASYSFLDDVVLNPPEGPCQVVFDGKDEMIGRRRKDIAAQPLLRFTPLPLRGKLGDKDFIEIDASMTAAYGGLKVLNLEIRVASKNAQVEFGRLETKSLLNFKLINGEVVKLLNKTMDFGRYDKVEKVFVYQGQ